MSLFAAHLNRQGNRGLERGAPSLGEGGGVRGSGLACKSKKWETSMLGRLWRPRPELGAGHPSWLRSLVPALSSASHHNISMSRAKVCSQPPPHVSVFVTSSVLAAPEGGVGGGGGPFYFCSGKAVFGSSTWCRQPGARFGRLCQLTAFGLPRDRLIPPRASDSSAG